jgi:hypothetical protein
MNMKKTVAFLLLVSFILCLSACDLDGVAYFYSYAGEYNGFGIDVNKLANCCFVSGYTCTEYTEGMEITIPDDYNGIPIKRIGGFSGIGAPSPFRIDLSQVYMNAPEGSEFDMIWRYPDDELSVAYTIENVVFQLNIGKNIEEIDFVFMDDYYPHINEDGTVTFYHPVVYITCSEENTTFYSKDGKLYYKSTNALVEDFAYPE